MNHDQLKEQLSNLESEYRKVKDEYKQKSKDYKSRINEIKRKHSIAKKEEITDRERFVMENAPLGLVHVGKMIGVTSARAGQILKIAKRKKNRKDRFAIDAD